MRETHAPLHEQRPCRPALRPFTEKWTIRRQALSIRESDECGGLIPGQGTLAIVVVPLGRVARELYRKERIPSVGLYQLTKAIPKHGGTTCRIDLKPIELRRRDGSAIEPG